MKTRRNRKAAGRRMLSFLLATALLFTMLPVSGVQKAKASEYPVQYDVLGDSEENKYVQFWGFTTDASSFVKEGTLEIPSLIEGYPVTECDGAVMGVSGTKKLILPETLGSFINSVGIKCTETEEIRFKFSGIIKNADFTIRVIADSDNVIKDIYFYPYDISSVDKIFNGSESEWETLVTTPITVHVGSQNILDKFNACEKWKKQIDAGRLNVVKDLDVAYDGRLVLPSLVTEAEQYTSDMENDYNKASWAALQTALADAKSVVEGTSDEDVLRIVDALQLALAGMVSVKSLNEAIAAAEPYEQEKDTYTNSTWNAVASVLEAARNVPDDVSSERAAELAKAIQDAVAALVKKRQDFLRIRCGNVVVPAVPEPYVFQSTSGSEVTYEYFIDEACENPVHADNPSLPPAEPGTYYVRGTTAVSEGFMSISDVASFTVYARSGEGFSLSDEGVLTITDTAALENEDTPPWHGVNPEVVSVELAPGVEPAKLGPSKFSGCKKLTKFTIPSTVTSLGESCFANSGLKEINIPVGVTSLGKSCFLRTNLTEIMLPDTVTSLGDNCFYQDYEYADKGLTKIAIPEGVTSIGDGCFSGNGNLKEVTLPSRLESIGKDAFVGCQALRVLDIPDTLKTLGEGAFKKSGISRLIIPEGVTSIGGNTLHGLFEGCAQLSLVAIKGTEYTVESMGGVYNMFLGVPETAVVLCDGQTYETLDAYSKTLDNEHKWPEGILRKPQEYSVEQKQAYQGEKEEISSLKEADYTADTWNSLQAAIARAEALSTAEGEDFEIALNQVAARRALAEGIIPCLQETAAKVREVLAGEDTEKDYDMEADSWWGLQDALEDADKMAEEGVADATDILAGMQAIKDAHAGLTLKSTEDAKKKLEDAVAAAKALVASDYTPESWKVLQDAIAEAEAEKASGKNSRIEAAQKKVDEAVAALGKMPTDEAKAALEAAVATVTKDLKEADYTPESWKALQDALKEAEGIKGTGTISQIQAAQKKVEDAAAALKKKEETKPSASPSTKPTASPGANPTASPVNQPTKNPGGVNATQKPGGSDKSDKITVKKVTIKKAKSTKKKTITVQWKKVAGVTGYQVQLGTNKKVTKGKKTYTVKKAKTVKKTIKKLKRKKKYYVRVRAFKTVKGKKYYGKWSKIKTVKTK